jgi:hypothetical protein
MDSSSHPDIRLDSPQRRLLQHRQGPAPGRQGAFPAWKGRGLRHGVTGGKGAPPWIPRET